MTELVGDGEALSVRMVRIVDSDYCGVPLAD